MLNNNNGVNLSFFQNIVLNKEGTHAAAEWLHKVLYNILLSIAVPNNNKSISQKYHTWYPPNLADTGRLAIYSRNCWKHHLVNQSRLFLKQHSAVCVKFPTIVWTLQCLLFLTLYCSFVFFFYVLLFRWYASSFLFIHARGPAAGCFGVRSADLGIQASGHCQDHQTFEKENTHLTNKQPHEWPIQEHIPQRLQTALSGASGSSGKHTQSRHFNL